MRNRVLPHKQKSWHRQRKDLRTVPNRGIAEQLRHTAKCLLLKVDNDAWIEVSPRLGSSDPSEKELASQANIIEFLLGEGEGEDD